MKQFIKLMLVMCAVLLLHTQNALAEVKIIETQDSYIMDNSFKNTMDYATEQAREKAKRRAAEEAGTYIESHSEVINSKLTKDRIIVIASTIMEVLEDDIHYNTINDNKNIEVICKIKVKVDTSKISAESLAERGQLLKKIEELNKQMAKYEEKIKLLEEQNKKAASSNQKQQIQNEISESQRQFLIAKYEKDIDIYDFNNEINYKSMMETAQKLIEIDPQNTSAFLAMAYSYRLQDQLPKTVNYCNNVLNSKSSSQNLKIEAYTQLGDIYLFEYNDKTKARQFINNGIALVKKQYSKSEIEKFVNGSGVEVLDLGEYLVGKDNSIRELYILKSIIEGINPTFDAINTVIDLGAVSMSDRIYNLKYKTDW